MLLTSWGGTEYAWGSRVILGLARRARRGTALLFLVVEHFAPEPIIPLRLFRDSVFNVTGLVGAVVGVALFGAASYLPTFLQMVDGASATESGLLMLPMMGGIVVASDRLRPAHHAAPAATGSTRSSAARSRPSACGCCPAWRRTPPGWTTASGRPCSASASAW